jgi:hypothetical protein
MDLFEKYLAKSGYGNGNQTINLTTVFAAIKMADDNVFPDGSCPDDVLNIWEAVQRAKAHASETSEK